MRTRVFLFALLFMAAFSQVHAQWDGTSSPWTQGNGTRNNPYQISTPNQMAYLSDMVSAGYDYAGQYFLLTNNISLSNQSWYPIGDASHIFKGNFDGGGHLVDSINVINSSFSYKGLYGFVKNDTIKNLHVKACITYNPSVDGYCSSGCIAGRADSSTFVSCVVDKCSINGGCVGGFVGETQGVCKFIDCIIISGTIQANQYYYGSSTSYAGGITGTSSGNILINNCRINVTTLSSNAYGTHTSSNYTITSYCGGLVGVAQSSSINGCTLNISTLLSYSRGYNTNLGYKYVYSGGIFGRSNGSSLITECIVDVDDLSAQSLGTTNDRYVGGVVGLAATPTSITGCFFGGKITNGYYVGGIIGYAQAATSITKCINHAVIKGSYTGGIIGYCSNTLTISQCANLDSVYTTTSTYAGGIVGYAYKGEISYCYNVGDVGTASGGTRSGIGYINTTPRSITNCYNTGTITGTGTTYGIGSVFTNSYYREGCGATSGGTPRTMANMKSVSFPIILNADSTVFVMDLLNENNGYPVFAYSTIYDITTDSVTNKTSYSAQLNGHCGGIADSVGFVYRLVSSSDSVRVVMANATSPAHYELDGLQPNTSYIYRFFAMHNGQTVYGAPVTFTTHPFYTLSLASNNSQWGSVSGGGTFAYGTSTPISATAFTNYRFLNWSDGNQTNPRNYVVTQNETVTAVFGPAIYNITLASNNNAWGSVSGGGSFNYNASATITATPAPHYHFVSWSDGNDNNPRTLIVTNDLNLTATFAPDTYTITSLPNNATYGSATGSGTFMYGDIDTLTATAFEHYRFTGWSDGNTNNPRYLTVTQDSSFTAMFVYDAYTLSLSVNNPAWGTVSGGGMYEYGQQATVTATASEHFHFVGWYDANQTVVSTSNPYTLMITTDVSLQAVFAPNNYSVTVQPSNPAWGSTTGSGTFAYGSIDTITATPIGNHVFAHWNDGTSSNPRHFTVQGDTTITAVFAPSQCTLTLTRNNNQWGTVSGGGTFQYGQTAYCTAVASTGYHFVEWSDGNTDNPRVYTVEDNITLQAIFAPNQYTITLMANDTTKGSVSGGGTYDYQQQVYIIAIPADGYAFSQWSDGNTSSYRQITVTQNMTYTAVFTDIIYNITVTSSNPTYGYVTGGGQYARNSTATLTAVPNQGYHFEQWSDGNTQNPRIVTVAGDMTYYALFAPDQYTITVTSANPGMGSAIGSGVFAYGTQTSITATPMQHHRFLHWNDGITTNPRLITVAGDSAFTAYFEAEEQYTVTVVSGNPDRGTVSGGGTYYNGEQITITASAFSGYTFDHWSDGNTQSTRTITVATNTTYTAYFAAPMYTVNVSCNENEGIVSGGGTYEQGTSVTVTATPNQGYRFVRWSNGVETDVYTFEIFSNVNLVANFERTTQGISDVENSFDIKTVATIVSVMGADNMPVIITDIVGRIRYTNSQYMGEAIDVQHSGVYLIKVGNATAKKIVIIK